MNLATCCQQAHECDWTCQVVHEFGNVYRCTTSGMMHICDSNCDQRLWNGAHSTICRISKKLHPPFMEVEVHRKRGVQDTPQSPLSAEQQERRKRAVFGAA